MSDWKKILVYLDTELMVVSINQQVSIDTNKLKHLITTLICNFFIVLYRLMAG